MMLSNYQQGTSDRRPNKQVLVPMNVISTREQGGKNQNWSTQTPMLMDCGTFQDGKYRDDCDTFAVGQC